MSLLRNLIRAAWCVALMVAAGGSIGVHQEPIGLRAAINPATRAPGAVRVPILMYHRLQDLGGDTNAMTLLSNVFPEDFAGQMNWLKANNYHTITLDQLADALDGRGTLPDNPVALSFDDGWACHAEVALPILRRHGFTATFFVFPGVITDGGGNKYMTWDQLADLLRHGMSIQSHTLTHPMLPTLDEDAARHEIAESKHTLESRLNTRITAIAYPFGEATPAHEQLAQAAGYRIAVGVKPGCTHTPGGRMHLQRINVVYHETLDQFAATVRGEDIPGITSPRPRSPRGDDDAKTNTVAAEARRH